jgi:Holliday junction resolvase RusA-like endonuclease
MAAAPRTFRAEAIMMTTSDDQLVNDDDIILHIEIDDEPLVAERPRFRFLHSTRRAICYDPQRANKRAIRSACRLALEECGVTRFPFFSNKELKVVVTFYLINRRKDVDNLLKFILDALQTVAYKNDCWIFDIRAKKKAVPSLEGTTIEVEVLHDDE